MLYYYRIDLNEGTDLSKSNSHKECEVCHYCYFNHGFKFQSFVCNGCHDLIISCLILMLVILLLSLLKVLIIVVLFMVLTNLMQLFVREFCA